MHSINLISLRVDDEPGIVLTRINRRAIGWVEKIAPALPVGFDDGLIKQADPFSLHYRDIASSTGAARESIDAAEQRRHAVATMHDSH